MFTLVGFAAMLPGGYFVTSLGNIAAKRSPVDYFTSSKLSPKGRLVAILRCCERSSGNYFLSAN